MLIFAVLVGVLASCGVVQKLKPKKGLFFDGHQFRASAEQVGEEREEFLTTVRRASQSAVGAREAGRHASVRYCINQFGRSDIEWAEGQGPDDENIEDRISDDLITFRGRCEGW